MIKRFKNSILLSAIGDAIGWITEFEKSEDSLVKKYGRSRVESFINWEKRVGGRFNGYTDMISSGSYSDDTQLLLAIARSIEPNGLINNEYFAKTELPAWLDYARGAGRTIKNAAKKIERKSAKWNNNFFTYKAGKKILDYKDSGANGAAMRILPIALSNHGNFDFIKECIFSNSIITHGHPRAIVGAILYGLAIDSILKEEASTFSYDSFLTGIGKNLSDKLSLNFLEKEKYKSWIDTWNEDRCENFQLIYQRTIEEALQGLRIVYSSIRDNKKTSEVLKILGCFSPSTQGSGISTVLAGIFLASKFNSSPRQAIIRATNSLGSDTDSIASFTGGLLGALNDSDVIPEDWQTVQDSEYLVSVAKRLFDISERKLPQRIILYNTNNLNKLNRITSDVFSPEEVIFFDPLGQGKIKKVERQQALTSGKYNLILDVQFDLGQSCRFSKLLDYQKNNVDPANMLFKDF